MTGEKEAKYESGSPSRSNHGEPGSLTSFLEQAGSIGRENGSEGRRGSKKSEEELHDGEEGLRAKQRQASVSNFVRDGKAGDTPLRGHRVQNYRGSSVSYL